MNPSGIGKADSCTDARRERRLGLVRRGRPGRRRDIIHKGQFGERFGPLAGVTNWPPAILADAAHRYGVHSRSTTAPILPGRGRRRRAASGSTRLPVNAARQIPAPDTLIGRGPLHDPDQVAAPPPATPTHFCVGPCFADTIQAYAAPGLGLAWSPPNSAATTSRGLLRYQRNGCRPCSMPALAGSQVRAITR